ncbi:Bax inhibitor-1/YccA family protein [Lachnospiraceae bacterium 62-35]
MENNTQQYYSQSYDYPADSLGRYTSKTFGWMFAGLLATFLIAYFGYATRTIIYVFAIPYAPIILAGVELAVVLYLSARLEKMSVMTAKVLFFMYAILNGVVFSAYFLIYNMRDLILVFGATALFFGIMAVLGYVTNADFSKIVPFMTAGLIFLIGFWFLSIFINLERFETIICTIGIFVFLVFTAYDTQKIKAFHAYYSANPEMAAKASIFSALQLYLDFINLFLYLLRFVSRKK